MTKARLIYLLVISSLLVFFLASYVRLPIGHCAGFATGDSGFASGAD
jgi:hypothetical protein